MDAGDRTSPKSKAVERGRRSKVQQAPNPRRAGEKEGERGGRGGGAWRNMVGNHMPLCGIQRNVYNL